MADIRSCSPYRHAIVVLGCGEPIAATFIFSFSEVFAAFFPMLVGYLGLRLLREDWRRAEAAASAARGA